MKSPRIHISNLTSKVRAYLFAIWCCAGLFAMAQGPGVIDLRESDFSEPIPLNGLWEFYWNKLLQPGEKPEVPGFTQFPGLWTEQVSDGKTFPSFGYASYRSTIRVSNDLPTMALFIDDMYCAYHLYVNGKLVAKNGKVGRTGEEYLPQWKPQVVELGRLPGQSELILQIANFDHSSGGNRRDLLIGTSTAINQYWQNVKNQDIFLFCLLMVLTIFFIIRFSFISFDYASLYFSLFCFFMAYRFVGSDHYVIHEIFPEIPWHILIGVEYLVMYLMPIWLGMHIKELYPKDANFLIVKIVIGISVVFGLLVFITPPVVYSGLRIVWFLVAVLMFGYAYLIVVLAYSRNRKGAILGVVSASAISLVIVFIMFENMGLLPQFPYLFQIGFIIFLAMQSVHLLIRSQDQEIHLTEE